MKVAVVGSRDFHPLNLVDDMLKAIGPVTVVSGGARGVDRRSEEVSRSLGYPAPIVFKPAWKRPDGTVDKGAGMRRNAHIVNAADVVIAFWDGVSNGTKNSIMRAWNKGMPLIVFISNGHGVRVKADNLDGEQRKLRELACKVARASSGGDPEDQGQDG